MAGAPIQSAPLALAGIGAPAAVAPGASTDQDVLDAESYKMKLRSHVLNTPPTALGSDYVAAKVYEFEVLADRSGGIANAVTTAVNANLNANLGPAVNAAVNAAVAPLLKSSAQTQNEKIFEATKHNRQLAVAKPLVPLPKTVAGLGLGFAVAGVPIPAEGLPNLAVGFAPAQFPANAQAAKGLTSQELSNLSAIYNETFGVVAGDNLNARREKFLGYIQGIVS